MGFLYRYSYMEGHKHKTLPFNPGKKGIAVLAFLAIGVISAGILFFSIVSNHAVVRYTEEGESDWSKGRQLSLHQKPSPPKKTKSIEKSLARDDTLYSILIDKHISPGEISDLLRASEGIHNLGKIKPGNTLKLEINTVDSTIRCLKYEIDKDHVLVVERTANGFSAKKETIQYDIKVSAKSGVISSSLFDAVLNAGLASLVALDLSDIFMWDIDFDADIRQGDLFKILLEQKYRDGNCVEDGKILCAEFVNQGKSYPAVLFEDEDGHVDYYDPEGKSLRKKFLKSPLRYKYISSRYSKRRLHPILKIYRPHLGIDYAAPIGTPVTAVGDGKVVFTGWKGGYGRFIKIKHNGSYNTTYGHLSRFANGIKQRGYVKQGQVIGYVGSTGLSTGPHLDFRLIKNGRFVNPLTCNLPSASPVKKRYMEDFKRVKKKMLSRLEELDTDIAAYGG